MLHNDYLLSDESPTDDQWTDLISMDWRLWTDSRSLEGEEYDIALHNFPTEQELMDMEADKDTGKPDDFLFRKERRTALRH